VPEEQLHSPEIARLLINLLNLRRLGPAHRMGAVCRAIQPGTLDPVMNDPGRIAASRGAAAT
jgi:hypothetical protein